MTLLVTCTCMFYVYSFTPAPTQATALPVRQPRGRKPCGNDGRPCKWDPRGYWKQSDESQYVRQTGADRVRQSRERRTDDQRRERQKAQAAAQRERRANLTDDQRRERQDARAAAQRERRANLTDDQRRERQEAQAAAQRERRANLTDDQRRERQEAQAEAQRERCANLTDGQRRERQEAQAEAQHERREAMPYDKKRMEDFAQQQAQEARRAAADDKQRQRERDATAKAVRTCRGGVTPLWNALQLPVGQREDQLLYDLHASGSGFTTVNSRRLRTLTPGSLLHEECVDTVLPEISLRGHVTVADRARMVSAYAERQREAAQLRSCGCCGTRDPSMWYSEPKRLHELPMDHWARIDDAAYADLLNANVLELMNVKEEKVNVPRVEWHNCFECGESAYHVIPEAVEADENGLPCIRVCKHCHKHWSRPRDEPVCKRRDGLYDHLYWSGAPNASVAAGHDFGRISHLKKKYGIETRYSRLEQLVLASVRTQYVSYKVVAFDNQTQRRRLHGHTISFPHAPQRFTSVKLTFRPARALTDERRRRNVVKWLASGVGVAVAVVCLGDCSEDAHGLQLPVTIGPLPTGMAETVGDKLRACIADLAEVVKQFGVPLVAVEEPRLESTMWTFCEAVLHAAGATAKPKKDLCVYRRSHACCFDDARLAVDAVAIQFVGPSGMCQTRLDRGGFSIFLYRNH